MLFASEAALTPLPHVPPEPIGKVALMRAVWRYGDSSGENGRIVRTRGGWYHVLLRVDVVRWRVLAGQWVFRYEAMNALCKAWGRHHRSVT